MRGVTERPGRTDDRVLVAFILLATIWGASFLFIKEALGGFSPVQVAAGRVGLGAITLFVIMTASGRRWPRGRIWGHLVAGAIPLCVLPMLLYAWASQHLPSGLESVYNATTPLMTLLIAALLPGADRLTRGQIGGFLIGAAGVLIVLAPWHLIADTGALAGTGWAQLACLAATCSYGAAFNYTRRFISPHKLDPVTIAASQIGSGALMLLALVPFTGMTAMAPGWRSVGSLLALGVLGTGIAYIWNNQVIIGWGATNASTVTYAVPIVGLLLGILVLGETLTWNLPVGGAIVVTGILISQRRLHLPRRVTIPFSRLRSPV